MRRGDPSLAKTLYAIIELDRQRRDLLFKLTKKYGTTLAEVIATGDDAKRELDLVDSAGLDIRQLETRERAARVMVKERAAKLTELRRGA